MKARGALEPHGCCAVRRHRKCRTRPLLSTSQVRRSGETSAFTGLPLRGPHRTWCSRPPWESFGSPAHQAARGFRKASRMIASRPRSRPAFLPGWHRSRTRRLKPIGRPRQRRLCPNRFLRFYWRTAAAERSSANREFRLSLERASTQTQHTTMVTGVFC